MDDVDRETLEHLLRPADPNEPLPVVELTDAERAESHALTRRMLRHIEEHADELAALRAELDRVA